MTLREIAQQAERDAIASTLQRHATMTSAASELGITRKTLWWKMRRFGLERRRFQPQTSMPLDDDWAFGVGA